MMRAILVSECGGPEQLVLAEREIPTAGPGQVLVKLAASGVNFIDVYHRTGLYPQPMPFTPGMEGAGTVAALGEGVEGFSIGDRVAYALHIGSYAEYAVVPAKILLPVPASVSLDLAAAVLLQGMTAHYLAHSTFALGPQHTCVVHAAGGGVGLLLTQIAKKIGAFVIGTTSAAPGTEKYELVRSAGADAVLPYEGIAEKVRELTDGKGADVVYDSVGASTFQSSLKSLRPRGLMVSYGNASGPVSDFSLLQLSANGSLFVTRPTLGHYSLTREEILWRSGALFDWIGQGELNVRVDRVYPLAEAGQAHRDLEARKTSGKLLLKP
jgi:NADPH:quinone reductase